MIKRDDFEKIAKSLYSALKPKEYLILGIAAEESDFVRVNQSKVRQAGRVEEILLSLELIIEAADGLRKSSTCFNLKMNPQEDLAKALAQLKELKEVTTSLPVDLYAQLPIQSESSESSSKGKFPSKDQIFSQLLVPLQGLDAAGLYAGGKILRGMSHSLGLSHWFETESFSFDFSVFDSSQRAVKELYAGGLWNESDYQKKIENARLLLEGLSKPCRKVGKGRHRAYLAPAAVHDILGMFSWGGLSEASIQNGESPLRKVREGSRQFSPLFSLSEDFRSGLVPRFTSEGELAPEFLPLIEEGRLKSSLVSRRSAKEFSLTSTAANGSETLRSARMKTGNLDPQNAMKSLDEGLWISNLHYLNWSDQPAGRITGMTRYACMWIENGKPVGPLENMRFDDTLFSVLGDELEDIDSVSQWIPDTSTYEMRSLGGLQAPGMLLKNFHLTL